MVTRPLQRGFERGQLGIDGERIITQQSEQTLAGEAQEARTLHQRLKAAQARSPGGRLKHGQRVALGQLPNLDTVRARDTMLDCGAHRLQQRRDFEPRRDLEQVQQSSIALERCRT